MIDPIQKAFLTEHGMGDGDVLFLAGDASPRQYYRVRMAEGRSAVMMTEPPQNTSMPAFLHVADLLCKGGLKAPCIYGASPQDGLLLLEDLGDMTFNKALGFVHEADLYQAAADVLIDIYKQTKEGRLDSSHIGFYSHEVYAKELAVFIEWYLPYVCDIILPQKAAQDFFDLWEEALVPVIKAEEKTLVLRDYHIDNLLWMEEGHGLHRVGLLDFQDALYGHLAYDLVSLLEDARRDVPASLQKSIYAYFLDALPEISREAFWRDYHVIGAQRSTKVLGVFARIAKKRGLFHYLAHLPRVWQWVEQDLTHPFMARLQVWYDTHIPKEIRSRTTIKEKR